MKEKLKIGKLTNAELESMILNKIEPFREDVVLRPGIGIDCGGIKMGNDICMLSSDPITAASKDAGYLAVHVSCNDAAAAGAEPIGLLLTFLIPVDYELNEVAKIFEQAQESAKEINVEIIGGHTEITNAVNKLIICSTVVAKAKDGIYFSSKGAKIGDAIIVTKFAAMEGTAIIASDYPHLIDDILDDEEIKDCEGLSRHLSVIREGLAARELNITAMHDVTEGGVLGALWEVCESSDCGGIINLDKVPILETTRKICNKLDLDPYKLISSGCMLMTTPDGDKCVSELKKRGVVATIVGMIKQGNLMMIKNNITSIVEPPQKDEIYKCETM